MGWLSKGKFLARNKKGEISTVSKSSRGSKVEDHDGPSRRRPEARHFSSDDDAKYRPIRGRKGSYRGARDDYEVRGRRGYEAHRPGPDSDEDEYYRRQQRGGKQPRRQPPEDYANDESGPPRRARTNLHYFPDSEDDYSPPRRVQPKSRHVALASDDDYSPPRRVQPKSRYVAPNSDEYRGSRGRLRPQRFEPSDDEEYAKSHAESTDSEFSEQADIVEIRPRRFEPSDEEEYGEYRAESTDSEFSEQAHIVEIRPRIRRS